MNVEIGSVSFRQCIVPTRSFQILISRSTRNGKNTHLHLKWCIHISESSAYKRSTAPKQYFSTGTGSASRPETGNATSTYHRSDNSWHRTVPSLASELELHIALGMLEERSDEKIQPSHGDGAGLGSRYGADLYRDDPDGSHAYRSRPTTYSSRYSSRFGQL